MKLTKLLFWTILLIGSIIFADANPFELTGFLTSLYFVPFFIGSFWMIERTYQPKGVFEDPKYLKMIQSLIAVLSMLVAAGIKIPLLNQLIDLLGVFSSNWEEIGGTVKFVLGLYVLIRSIFADSGTPIIGHAIRRLETGGHEVITPRENHL